MYIHKAVYMWPKFQSPACPGIGRGGWGVVIDSALCLEVIMNESVIKRGGLCLQKCYGSVIG